VARRAAEAEEKVERERKQITVTFDFAGAPFEN
jgi:hypothetical protein